MKKYALTIWGLSVLVCLLAVRANAAPVQLQAYGRDNQPLPKLQNPEVWSCEAGKQLTFRSVGPVKASPFGVLYMEVAYLDEGYGKLRVEVPGTDGKPLQPDRFLQMSRTNGGGWARARMRLNGVKVAENGELTASVSLQGERDKLLIKSASVQEEPYADQQFLLVISNPWLGPYKGPSEPADNTTLKGKVMVGYQGWFRTPNDPYGLGAWFHWGNIRKGHFNIDMWPEISDYAPEVLERACDLRLKSGKPAYLFSSAWPQVVDTHFRWMREHDIDGAFLQRFVGSINGIKGKPEWVLANTRAAANRQGRLWAVEYDVSGGNNASVYETLTKDWIWLVDTFQLLQDPNYAHEAGRPVVFLWGLPVESRGFSPEVANKVVEFFKNDPKYGGNYVIGGVPGNWRKLDGSWQEHIKKYDSVLAWMSASYEEDLADLGKLGINYYPHVKPGFSWANLMHLPTWDLTVAYTPREGGERYWKMLNKVAQSRADRLFVGMFDEYDEGTAIMPMSDDAPPTPVQPGVAADFYQGQGPRGQGEFKLLPKIELALGAQPTPKIPAENFFVRMRGEMVAPAAGRYLFSLEGAAGDDAELFVNGKKILGARNLKGAVVAGEPVEASKPLQYRFDYRHKNGKGTLRLSWESEGMPRQVVPEGAFRDAWGRFLTNEGRPPEWWLQLTRMGKEMLNGKRPADSPMPEPQ